MNSGQSINSMFEDQPGPFVIKSYKGYLANNYSTQFISLPRNWTTKIPQACSFPTFEEASAVAQTMEEMEPEIVAKPSGSRPPFSETIVHMNRREFPDSKPGEKVSGGDTVKFRKKIGNHGAIASLVKKKDKDEEKKEDDLPESWNRDLFILDKELPDVTEADAKKPTKRYRVYGWVDGNPEKHPDKSGIFRASDESAAEHAADLKWKREGDTCDAIDCQGEVK